MAKTDLILRLVKGTPLTHAEHDANFDRLLYFSGAWSAGTYTAQELVRHNGDSWICIVSSTTNEPGTSAGLTDWARLSQNTKEIWQATPIVGMTSNVIQWTFVPLYTGQTPVLMSHASGVLTFLTDNVTLDFNLTAGITQNIAANNQAVEWRITPAYSGVGISTLLACGGSLGSPRAGAFPASNLILGEVLGALNDTVTFTGSSSGDGASLADLDAAYLEVNGPAP